MLAIVEATPLYWYVARTRYGQELKIRDRLRRHGVEHFIPTEPSEGPRKERAIINNLIFLHTTKPEALAFANNMDVKIRYIIDCVTRTLLIVPDKEMADFQRVFREADDISLEPLSLGDRVRVIRGPLRGVEGHVLEFRGKCYVVVGLLDALFAKAQVPRSYLEKC